MDCPDQRRQLHGRMDHAGARAQACAIDFDFFFGIERFGRPASDAGSALAFELLEHRHRPDPDVFGPTGSGAGTGPELLFIPSLLCDGRVVESNQFDPVIRVIGITNQKERWMNSGTSITNKSNNLGWQAIKLAGAVMLAGIIFIGMLAVIWFTQTSAGTSVAQSLQSVFAMDSVQAWWYITRASGLTAYFIMWLSMVWGMAISTRFFHPAVEGAQSYDFHEFLSLLGLGFLLLHIIVLMFDQFLPFSIWQILIPFTDSYRPLWVGLGIIGAYLFLLVTVTFYMRKTIGSKAFRSIHMLSIVGYVGATLHGLFAGTDSALPVTRVIYIGTFLIVLFLTAYWIVMGMISKREQATAAERAAKARRQSQRLRLNQR